jgi:hypothetical protein
VRVGWNWLPEGRGLSTEDHSAAIAPGAQLVRLYGSTTNLCIRELAQFVWGMESASARLNITLDAEHEKRPRLAQRIHVQDGTLARSLLSTALDEADPDARTVTEVLDAIPGPWERAESPRDHGAPTSEAREWLDLGEAGPPTPVRAGQHWHASPRPIGGPAKGLSSTVPAGGWRHDRVPSAGVSVGGPMGT